METIPAVLNRFFGTHIKIVSGYKGGNEIYLAMQRGEVDGRCAGLVSSIKSTRPDWFPQKKVAVPVVIAFARMPMFPDAPAVAEFARDEVSRQVLRRRTSWNLTVVSLMHLRPACCTYQCTVHAGERHPTDGMK